MNIFQFLESIEFVSYYDYKNRDCHWNKFVTQTQYNGECVYFFSAPISIFFNELTPWNVA